NSRCLGGPFQLDALLVMVGVPLFLLLCLARPLLFVFTFTAFALLCDRVLTRAVLRPPLPLRRLAPLRMWAHLGLLWLFRWFRRSLARCVRRFSSALLPRLRELNLSEDFQPLKFYFGSLDHAVDLIRHLCFRISRCFVRKRLRRQNDFNGFH